MAANFDPYHIWLGIPPEEQPANHYRLLGVRQFETNADAIDSAADRQMAHLRTFQTGKHADLSQRLLNELAAARICLLDPKRRAGYDQQLRAKLAAAPIPAAPVAAAPAVAQNAPGGSGIQRQPPRRAPVASPMQPQAPPVALPQTAATPQPADVWDDLLGDPSGKAAKTAAAKRNAAKRMITYAVAAAVVIAAGIGVGIFVSGGSSPSSGTLVFDLPAADRSETTVAVDNKPIILPSDDRWNCPPGTHHIVGQRPAYKFAADVTVVAGQEQKMSPEWRPKAVLVLNLPPELRGGELKVDGRLQTVTQQMPLEIPVQPGQHLIQVTRPGFPPVSAEAAIGPDEHYIVSIGRQSAAPANPTPIPAPTPTPAPAQQPTATLVFNWPDEQRFGATVTVDGRPQFPWGGSDEQLVRLALEPGRHAICITRAGFLPFNVSVNLAPGANQPIRPIWNPIRNAPPTVAVRPQPAMEIAPQPVKKLAPPSAAEIERIVKQIDNLYKTAGAGSKDPAKAQELYDVAAKDGSSPAERYVLLMIGAEIAAAGGDLNLALMGIDTLDDGYEIDALGLKQKMLDKFIGVAKPDQVDTAIPVAEQLVDQAVAADRYDIAIVFATTASKAVAKSKIATHKEDADRLSRRRHDIHLLEPIYAAAKKAQETLEKAPADPEANLTVGRWRCFYKNDWPAGLPLLAKGSDEKLKSLAEQELKAPTDAEQQAHLADAWWDVAQKEVGTARDSIHLHAGEIYQTASPNLKSALRKAVIEKRLAEIANLEPIVAAAVASKAAGAAGLSEKPAGPSKIVAGPWVDLLRQVDPQADAENGKWSRSGNDVTCDTAYDGELKLNAAPSESYDFEIDFTPTGPKLGTPISVKSCVMVRFTVGSRMAWMVLGDLGDPGIGLKSDDNSFTEIQSNPVAKPRIAIQDGHRYREIIRVRRLPDDLASIDVLLNGAPCVPRWVVPVGRLTVLGPTRTHLTLVSGENTATFHMARMRTVKFEPIERGSTLANAAGASRPASGQAPLPPGDWTDLLKLIDIDKNVVAGKWWRSGTDITVAASQTPRIAIPISIDGGYDLVVDFTRTSGKHDVAVMLSVAGHPCMVNLSAAGGAMSGLQNIDEHQIFADKPIVVKPGYLENDRYYRLSIQVRILSPDRASIDVALDGKPYLPHWEGSPASLSASKFWPTPNPNGFGLGAQESDVTFHAVRLRMLSGHATLDPDAAKSPTP